MRIERENKRIRHDQIARRVTAAAEGVVVSEVILLFCAFPCLARRMGVMATTDPTERARRPRFG